MILTVATGGVPRLVAYYDTPILNIKTASHSFRLEIGDITLANHSFIIKKVTGSLTSLTFASDDGG